MTIKEAMENLELCVHYAMSDYNTSPDEDSEDEESLSMAIEAMKKQIPMMVTRHKHIIECPNCGLCFEFESLRRYEPEYCDECGQKLDWED